eukprot:s617_g20.t1
MSMTATVGIVNCIDFATTAHAQLKRELHADWDLAHGPIELLREVLQPLKVTEEHPDLQRTLEFVKLTLLLLKGLLLQWDVRNFPCKVLEVPLRKLPKVWPNRCWYLDHPDRVTLAAEVKSTIRFMDTNSQVFEAEPWVWLYETLDALDLALSQ